jgi:hypothetical protein
MVSQLGIEDIGKYIDQQGLNNITIGRVAYIVLGVLAICKDPRAFHDYNLIKRLEDGIKEYPVVGFNHPFPYSLAVLALCTSGHGQQSYSTYTMMLKKMILENTGSVHAGDTIAMATMALSCMYERQAELKACNYRYRCRYRCRHRHRPANRPRACNNRYRLRRIISYATRWLRRQQKRDGSFGNSITTALAAQVH